MTEYRFGDICKVINGRAYRQPELLDSGKYPVLRVGNFFYSDRWFYSDLELPEDKYCDNGDLLFAWSASFGPRIWDGGKVIYHYHIWKLEPDDTVVDKYYLYYWLRKSVGILTAGTHGSVMAHMTKGDMENQRITLPNIEVQRQVGKILRLIDDKIKTNSKINDNLQQQAIVLYTSMFLDNPALETTAGTLKDIADITMGQSPSGSSYNEDGNGEVFYQGRAEFGYRFPTRRLFTTEPKRMAEAGDVLLSVRAPVGDLNVAYERCCIGRGLGAIHGRNGHQSFVLYTMFALRPQLDVYNGEGTVFGSINRNALNDMPINIPSDETIAAFETVVRPMDDMIRTNYEENCRLQELRDSLLPRLMSGEVDVSDIDI